MNIRPLLIMMFLLLTMTACQKQSSRKVLESGNAVYPNDYGLSATFTTTMACYVQAIYVNVTSGTTLTNLIVKPQIAKSSVTEYVPYGSIGVQVRGTNLVDLAYAKQ